MVEANEVDCSLAMPTVPLRRVHRSKIAAPAIYRMRGAYCVAPRDFRSGKDSAGFTDGAGVLVAQGGLGVGETMHHLFDFVHDVLTRSQLSRCVSTVWHMRSSVVLSRRRTTPRGISCTRSLLAGIAVVDQSCGSAVNY